MVILWWFEHALQLDGVTICVKPKVRKYQPVICILPAVYRLILTYFCPGKGLQHRNQFIATILRLVLLTTSASSRRQDIANIGGGLRLLVD